MSRTILLEGYLLELISSNSNSSSPWIQTRPIYVFDYNGEIVVFMPPGSEHCNKD